MVCDHALSDFQMDQFAKERICPMETSQLRLRLSMFRVQELCVARGWTRKKLCAAASISRNTPRNIELGKYSPTLDTVSKIAAALGVSPLSLLKEE